MRNSQTTHYHCAGWRQQIYQPWSRLEGCNDERTADICEFSQGLFLVAGIIVGLAVHMKEQELIEGFVQGAADLLGVAFIIAISRGITVIMNSGFITDTILNWGEQALNRQS